MSACAADGERPRQAQPHPVRHSPVHHPVHSPVYQDVQRLAPGERPPQFVVISLDGAGGDDHGWFATLLKAAGRAHAKLTFFLSGVPLHRRQSERLATAWRHGHELGTYFNGHVCGRRGMGAWRTREWNRRIDQFYALIENGEKLPFDVRTAIRGGRTPCRDVHRPSRDAAYRAHGWRYDASATGAPRWPRRNAGLWEFPLPTLPLHGTRRRVLASDQALYTAHSHARPAAAGKWPAWRRQTTQTYVSAVNARLTGDRAPVFIAHRFENWHGGSYMKALIDLMTRVCPKPQVRCVSFTELTDWLEAQERKTLARLRNSS